MVEVTPKASAHGCMRCKRELHSFFRKHHCRGCGGVFCIHCVGKLRFKSGGDDGKHHHLMFKKKKFQKYCMDCIFEKKFADTTLKPPPPPPPPQPLNKKSKPPPPPLHSGDNNNRYIVIFLFGLVLGGICPYQILVVLCSMLVGTISVLYLKKPKRPKRPKRPKQPKEEEQPKEDEQAKPKEEEEELDFDGNLLVTLFEKTRCEKGVGLLGYISASESLVCLMTALGSSFSPAVKDISGRLQTLHVRWEEYLNVHKPERKTRNDDPVTLEEIILNEIERGVERAGKKAAPAARTLLRVVWFVDMLSMLLLILGENENAELKSACSKAYDETLSKHHRWIIRKTFHAAMAFLPSRQEFCEKTGLQNLTLDETCKVFTKWSNEINKTQIILRNFYKKYNIENL